MTVYQILDDLKPVKPMSRDTLYGYLRKFKIKPVSKFRMCPQHYPDYAPRVIAQKLGLTTVKKTNGHAERPRFKNGNYKTGAIVKLNAGGAR